MCDVWDLEYSECGMFGIIDVGMWDVRDARCSRYGMFGMWTVRDMECSGCGILVYKMLHLKI